MKAWLFQEKRDVAENGAKGAPWCCGWYEPGPPRRRRKKKFTRKTAAENFRRQVEREMDLGTYCDASKTTWAEFRERYERDVLAQRSESTRCNVRRIFNHVERILKPPTPKSITTAAVDRYIAARLLEPGIRTDSKVQPSSAAKEVDGLLAALRRAKRWGMLSVLPEPSLPTIPEHAPDVMTPEHFASVFAACYVAKRPVGRDYAPADWWRALLSFLAVSGCRIGETLKTRVEDVDFASGVVSIRSLTTKQKYERQLAMPAGVIQRLAVIGGPDGLLFDWPLALPSLRRHFAQIQVEAGIRLPCRTEGSHRCSIYCRTYEFHSLRRMFASQNFNRLPTPALMKRLGHRDLRTTQLYVDAARLADEYASAVFVPEAITADDGERSRGNLSGTFEGRRDAETP